MHRWSRYLCSTGCDEFCSSIWPQARDISGAPASVAGVSARLLHSAEAEASLPGLLSRGQPALLLQGGAVVDVAAYLR